MDLQTIETNLIDYLDLPKNLSQIPFPIFEVEQAAKKVFQLEEFRIHAEQQKLISQEEISLFFENNPFHICLKATSLQSEAYCLMSQTEMNNFCSFLLEANPAQISDEEFLQALFFYATSQLLSSLQQTSFTKNINIQIQDSFSLPKEPLYDMPITLQTETKTATCHLAMTLPFQKDLFAHFQTKVTSIPTDLKKSLQIPLGLEIGSTELSYQEVSKLENGDFILLDRCTFDPDTGHGNVSFMLGEKSIFRGKIKEGEIKILDMPFETIGENSMQDDLPPFNEENPENNPLPPENKQPEPNAPLEPNKPTEESAKPADLPPGEKPVEGTPTDKPPTDKPIDQTPTDKPPTDKPATPPIKDTEEPWTASSETPTPSETSPAFEKTSATAIAPDQIPLNISIEVSRIQMSVEDFLQLQPGQTLQLGIHQNEGVELIVNGKKLAKGELIKIQDLLGVRITKLYS